MRPCRARAARTTRRRAARRRDGRSRGRRDEVKLSVPPRSLTPLPEDDHTTAHATRPDRDTLFRALTGEEFDLLVVGGGITGAGVARDAALRGLRVALGA